MNYKEQIKASVTLRECPVCGYPAEFDIINMEICCLGCGIKMGMGIGPAFGEVDTLNKLAEAWNTRDKESAAATLMGIKELARVKK